MIRYPEKQATETPEKNQSRFAFKNEGGPLMLPDPATPNAERRDLLPSPQNGWRDVFRTLHREAVDTINDLLRELDESGHLSAYAHENVHALRIARAVHQCESVEKMAVDRYNQILECARRIVRPRASSPDFENHRYREPTVFIEDLKLVEADLRILDAMGPAVRNRLITGYLISQSMFDFRAIDLIGSPCGGFDDDEMEFVRLLSVPSRAFTSLITPQVETILENIGILDDRYYEDFTVRAFNGITDHRETWVRVKSGLPSAETPESDVRFNLNAGLL